MLSFEIRCERIWNIDMFEKIKDVGVEGFVSVGLWFEQIHNFKGTQIFKTLMYHYIR